MTNDTKTTEESIIDQVVAIAGEIEDVTEEVTEDLTSMTREELIALIIKMRTTQKVTKATGRKDQVLQCLRTGINTIAGIADHLGTNSKNVSSQLTYLRKDGHMIYSIRFNNVTTLKLEEL